MKITDQTQVTDKLAYKVLSISCTFFLRTLDTILSIISNFPLISQSGIVNINELTLVQKIIGQCDIKHDITLPLKTRTVRHTAIVMIMSVSTFKTDLISYLSSDKGVMKNYH